MRNIRLRIAYDGSEFAGWQVQPGARTVQGEVERAVSELTGEKVRILCAGRTDSGVHALGQVANFQTQSAIPADKWPQALQGRLPPDVVVLDSDEVPLEFHATYSAVSKRYRYVIRRADQDDPFLGPFTWRVNAGLDIDAMKSASVALLGTHDFRCFESHWPNKATSVRTVFDTRLFVSDRWSVWSTASNQGPSAVSGGSDARDAAELLCFEIEADGFLYNMVRAIVGTLVDIGRGRWPSDALPEIIASQDRGRAGETAPAHGLYLVRVKYEDA